MAAPTEGRWDALAWDSDAGGWDVDVQVYKAVNKIRRSEAATAAVGRRIDIARAEVATAASARRVDE